MKTKLVILIAMLLLMLAIAAPAFARGPSEATFLKACAASGGHAFQGISPCRV